jgi:peptidoglycan hydrolase-like protein with peptidoglycan-binding domain
MGILERLFNIPTDWDDPDDYFPDDAFLDDANISTLISDPRWPAGRIPLRQLGAKLPNYVHEKGADTAGAGVLNPVALYWHWTGTRFRRKKPTPSLNVILKGRPGVPPRLANWLVGYTGSIHGCASGRANHAGAMNVGVLQEMARGELPRGGALQRGLRDTGGSGGMLLGVEVEGGPWAPPTAQQKSACKELAIVVHEHARWTPAQTAGWSHWHGTRRKIDYNVAAWLNMLTEIRSGLTGGPAPTLAPPKPAPYPALGTTAAVKAYQRKLGVVADGVAGPLTREAIKAWQKRRGIAVTGVLTPALYKLLMEG